MLFADAFAEVIQNKKIKSEVSNRNDSVKVSLSSFDLNQIMAALSTFSWEQDALFHRLIDIVSCYLKKRLFVKK